MLRIEAEGDVLRRIATDGERARDGFAREVIGEAGEVGVGHRKTPFVPSEVEGRATDAAQCSRYLDFARYERSLLGVYRDDAAPDLVELDRFVQRLKIAVSETLIALALDDLEEDRPKHVLGEDL